MEERENRIVWVFFVAFVAIIVLSLLFGCKTKTVVETFTEYVHDTVTSIKTDTVKEVRVQIVRDTTILKEIHTYTLNNVGDTIREIHHYHERDRLMVVDSTYRYRATVDSLQKALTEEKAKVKISVKDHIPKWVWIVLIANLYLLFLFFGRFLLPLLKKQGE